jgi:hypothetical protein
MVTYRRRAELTDSLAAVQANVWSLLESALVVVPYSKSLLIRPRQLMNVERTLANSFYQPQTKMAFIKDGDSNSVK